MSTAAPKSREIIPLEDRELNYEPLDGGDKIRLSVDIVRKQFCRPTKSGKMPSDADVITFMMLCRAARLNPWTGEVWLLGYDTERGPVFNSVTSVQSLFRRAEIHEQFDAFESGVIVKVKDSGEIRDCDGDFFDASAEELVGGWCKVTRRDRSKPFLERIRLTTFRRRTSIWNENPEGMISKCAEAGALRKAFAQVLGKLYTSEEMEHHGSSNDSDPTSNTIEGALKGLASQISAGLPEPEQKQSFREQIETAKPAETVEAKKVKAEVVEESVKTVVTEHCDTVDDSVDESFDSGQPDEIDLLREELENITHGKDLPAFEKKVKNSGLEEIDRRLLLQELKYKAMELDNG